MNCPAPIGFEVPLPAIVDEWIGIPARFDIAYCRVEAAGLDIVRRTVSGSTTVIEVTSLRSRWNLLIAEFALK